MALSPDERKIVETLKGGGKTNTEIFRIIAKQRVGEVEKLPDPTRSGLERIGSVALGAGKGFIEGARGLALGAQDVGENVFAGIAGTLDPNKTVGEVLAEIRSTPGIPGMRGEEREQVSRMLEAQNPDEKVGKVLGFIGELGVGLAPALTRVGTKLAARLLSLGARVDEAIPAAEVATKVTETPVVRGLLQRGRELFERIPRALERGREATQEAAERAQRIKGATPEVAQAIKVDLPDKYINFISEADEPTRKALVRVLDIADETPKTVGVKTNPTIVGGELASKQYDIIEKQRKLIGKQIGDAVESLPNATVNMRPSLGQLRRVLAENGIIVENGVLDISDSVLSKAQAARLQDLYDVAIRGGGVLDAKTVHGLDSLFSQLQREARFEQLDNIFLKVNGQDVNAFRLFRDIFRNQLDNLDPRIRELNREYAKFTALLDDIEDSIVKTPNFNVTKSEDAAEFAKVNLRRIFGEAQSSPAYEAVAGRMDEVARQLGYNDASPKDIAAFAQEIRELYKEAIPRAGFAGGFRSGISELTGRVLESGKVTTKDQRKALRALIEASLKKQ